MNLDYWGDASSHVLDIVFFPSYFYNSCIELKKDYNGFKITITLWTFHSEAV
jgi:hypothetical protein